jgi:hypothetical protein
MESSPKYAFVQCRTEPFNNDWFWKQKFLKDFGVPEYNHIENSFTGRITRDI